VGSILFPAPARYALTIEKVGENDTDRAFERELILDKSRFEGCAFSVRSVGNYSLSFRRGEPGEDVVIRLHHNGSLSFNADVQGDNFFPSADLLVPTLTPATSAMATTSFTTPFGRYHPGKMCVTVGSFHIMMSSILLRDP
jgi:hypothetical protein